MNTAMAIIDVTEYRSAMYVCMSENLYPARLIKRKRHSRAAVSNKQKR